MPTGQTDGQDCACPFLDACDAHLLHSILELLDARDLASVQRSCRALRDAGRDAALWGKLCDKRFGFIVQGDTQNAFRSLRDEFARGMLPFHGLMTDVGVDEPAKDFWAHKLFVASPRSMFCTAASIQNAHVWGVLSPWTDHEAVYSEETASAQATRWGRQMEEAPEARHANVGPDNASFSDDACVREVLSGSARMALQRMETGSLHRPLLMRRLIHVAEVLVPPTGQGPGTQSRAVHARALAALEHVSTKGLEDLLRLSYAAMAAMLSQRRVLGEPLGKALMEGVESPMQIAGLRGLAQDIMFGTSPSLVPDIRTFSEQPDPEASEAPPPSEGGSDKPSALRSLPTHVLASLGSLGHGIGSMGSRLLSPLTGGERSSTCRAGGPLYDKHAMLLALRHAHAAQQQGQATARDPQSCPSSAQASSQGKADASHSVPGQAANPAPVCVGLMEELLLSSHQHVTCPVKSGVVFGCLVPPTVGRHLSRWQQEQAGQGRGVAGASGPGQSEAQTESSNKSAQLPAAPCSQGKAQGPQQQQQQQQQQQRRGRAVIEGAAQDLLHLSSHPMVQACNNMTQAHEVLEASAMGHLPPVYNWFICREGEWIEFAVPASNGAWPVTASTEGPQGSSSKPQASSEGANAAGPRMHRVLEEAQLAPIVWFRVYTHDESEQWEEQHEAQHTSQPVEGSQGSPGTDSDSDFESGNSDGGDGSGSASPAYVPSLDDILRGKPAATAQERSDLQSRPPCPPLNWSRVSAQLLEGFHARRGQALSSSGPPQLPIQPMVVTSSMWEYSGVQPQASPNIAQAAPEFACGLGWGIHSDAPPGRQGQLHMRLHAPRLANCLMVKLIASHDLQPAFNRLRGGCNLDMGYVSCRGRCMALPAALRACGLAP